MQKFKNIRVHFKKIQLRARLRLSTHFISHLPFLLFNANVICFCCATNKADAQPSTEFPNIPFDYLCYVKGKVGMNFIWDTRRPSVVDTKSTYQRFSSRASATETIYTSSIPGRVKPKYWSLKYSNRIYSFLSCRS